MRVKKIYFILFFYFLINNSFCQNEKTAGGPDFNFYPPISTFLICPNESFQIIMHDNSCGTSCGVSYWMKDSIIIPGSNSNTLSITEAGNYKAIVNCGIWGLWESEAWVVKKNFTIYKLPENVPLSSAFNTLTLCSNDTFQLKLTDLSNSAASNHYQWQKNGISISNATTNVYTVADSGSYTLHINSLVCGNNTLGNYNVICRDTLPVPEKIIPDFILFPNPANEKLNIQLNNFDKTTLTIHDPAGEIIMTKIIHDKTAEIDISFLKNGIYYVSLKNGKTITRQKIIKSTQ